MPNLRNNHQREKFLDDLYRFLDDEMSPEEALAFERLLESDPRLERVYQFEVKFRKRLRQFAAEEMAEADRQILAGQKLPPSLGGGRTGRGTLLGWLSHIFTSPRRSLPLAPTLAGATLALAVLVALVVVNLPRPSGDGQSFATQLVGEAVLAYDLGEGESFMDESPIPIQSLSWVPASYHLKGVSQVVLDGELMASFLGEQARLGEVQSLRVELASGEGSEFAVYLIGDRRVVRRLSGLKSPLHYTCPITGLNGVMAAHRDRVAIVIGTSNHAELEGILWRVLGKKQE